MTSGNFEAFLHFLFKEKKDVYFFSWASFNVIEVMSSTKFTEKRIGYLAACQSFHQDTEVRNMFPFLLFFNFLSCKN